MVAYDSANNPKQLNDDDSKTFTKHDNTKSYKVY